MRVRIFYAALVTTVVLAGLCAMAQEMVATPDPVGGANTAVGRTAPNVPAGPMAGPAADKWRYRWYDGHWWYWTPQNRWMWYSDDGHWVAFDASPTTPPAAPQSGAGPVPYDASYPGPLYPAPGYYYPGRYWGGYYYPGVTVGVRPYGNVNVAVGAPRGRQRLGPARRSARWPDQHQLVSTVTTSSQGWQCNCHPNRGRVRRLVKRRCAVRRWVPLAACLPVQEHGWTSHPWHPSDQLG